MVAVLWTAIAVLVAVGLAIVGTCVTVSVSQNHVEY